VIVTNAARADGKLSRARYYVPSTPTGDFLFVKSRNGESYPSDSRYLINFAH
jgi:hypothetical protein